MTLRWRALEPAPHRPSGPGGVRQDTLVYAIGDIHGRDDLLERMLRGIADDARRRHATQRRLIYLGDYYSRGGQSAGVVERVLGWRPAGWDIITLRGNHEQLIQRFLEGDVLAGRHWLDYGGIATLAEYGLRVNKAMLRDLAALNELRQHLRTSMPLSHCDFLANLRLSHCEGDYFFAHAGVAPGVPLAQQSARDLVWIRQRFLKSTADHGAIVVHGHCISPEPEIRPNRIGIDTGAYTSGVLTCLVLEGTQRGLLQTVAAPPG